MGKARSSLFLPAGDGDLDRTTAARGVRTTIDAAAGSGEVIILRSVLV